MNNLVYVAVIAFSTHAPGLTTDVTVSNSYAKQVISVAYHEESVILTARDIRSAAYTSSGFDKALLDVKPRLDKAAEISAILAIDDAKHLLDFIALQYRPWVDVTEDGIAIIQWRAAKGGLALLFSGDKSVTVSERTMETNYVDSANDYDLSISTGAIISASLRNLYS